MSTVHWLTVKYCVNMRGCGVIVDVWRTQHAVVSGLQSIPTYLYEASIDGAMVGVAHRHDSAAGAHHFLCFRYDTYCVISSIWSDLYDDKARTTPPPHFHRFI